MLKFHLATLTYLLTQSTVSGDCIIDLEKDIPDKNDPIFLLDSPSPNDIPYSLAIPQRNGIFNLQTNQKLYLACTGNRNRFSLSQITNIHPTFLELTCSSRNKLVNGKTAYTLSDLTCQSKSASSIKFIEQICEEGGNLIHLGFIVNKFWFTVVTTCYVYQQGRPIWSKHMLYGTSIDKKANKKRAEQIFQVGGPTGKLSKIQNPDSAYKNKKAEFNYYFGGVEYIENTKGTQFFLARGHLAPDADFLFNSWQMLSYTYSNAAPQWQIINNGNWKNIEITVREFANRTKRNYEIYTGTHNVLELQAKSIDSNGNTVYDLRSAYLDPSKQLFPVPQIFWKIVHDPSNDRCIVLVSSNSPFTKPPNNPHTPVCDDICSVTNWPQWTNEQRGYTYCCNYFSIRSVVKEIPQVDCFAVLNYR